MDVGAPFHFAVEVAPHGNSATGDDDGSDLPGQQLDHLTALVLSAPRLVRMSLLDLAQSPNSPQQ